MKTKLITLSFLLLFSAKASAQDTGLTNYVDPRIGSEDWAASSSVLPAPTEW